MKQKNIDLSTIKTEIPKNLKKFDPSYVTRYAITAELIREVSGESKKLKILDVGGYNGALGDFLPTYDITILDMVDDDRLDNYVKASGAKMPFKDESFDIVVTCDTLEHIPAEERNNFIQELIRVSKDYVFLCAPFGTEKVEKAELSADTFYRSMAGESYIWLKEHKEFVLPKKEWIRTLLEAQKVSYYEFGHSSIDLWVLLLTGSFFLAGNIQPVNKTLYERLRKSSEKYLQSLSFMDFPDEEGYRTFYIISKQSQPTVGLPRYSKTVLDEYFNEVIVEVGSVMKDLSAGYGSAIHNEATLKKVNNELTLKLLAAEGELQSLRKRYEQVLHSKSYKLAAGLSKAKSKFKKT